MEIGGLTRRPVAIACHRIQWLGGIPDHARRSQTMHYSKLHPVRKQFATAWWSEVTESNCGRNNHWLHKVWDQRNFWFQSIASSVRTALKANIKALKSIPNLNWSQFNIMTFAANSPAQVDVITRYQTGLSSVPRGHHSNIMIVFTKRLWLNMFLCSIYIMLKCTGWGVNRSWDDVDWPASPRVLES